jgi:hypothetical protein
MNYDDRKRPIQVTPTRSTYVVPVIIIQTYKYRHPYGRLPSRDFRLDYGLGTHNACCLATLIEPVCGTLGMQGKGHIQSRTYQLTLVLVVPTITSTTQFKT